MSIKIYCFTGTGNSLMIAKAIAAELDDTEIVRISHDTSVEDSSTRVGLVFPVYYGGLPSIVQKFLPALLPFKDRYLFAIVTHAGGPGRALSQLRAELSELGLELSSGFHLRMPNNFIMGYEIPDADEVQLTLEKAESRIHSIVEAIRDMTIQEPPSEFSLYSGQSKRYHDFIVGVNDSDTQLWCDESCNECGLCVRICPVQNIVMENGRIRWLHHCEQCLACINWCPVRAIQYGQRTSDKGRYSNPTITIGDLDPNPENGI